MRTPTALAIWLLALSIPPNAAGETWNLVQSANFRIVGDVRHQDLALAARTLAQFRRVVLELFPERPTSSPRPLTVIVLGGRGIDRYHSLGADRVGGFFRRGTYEDFIVMRSSLEGQWLETVLHEYQHAITSNSWGRLPRWVSEGIAEFFSTFQMHSSGERYEIGLPIRRSLATLKQYGAVPVEEFLGGDWDLVDMDDVRRTRIFYAQSWALVHFFIVGDGQRWTPSFGPLVTALAAGDEPVDAFRRRVTPDLEAFNEAFRRHTRQFAVQYLTGNADPALAELSEPERSTLSIQETETLKAQLLADGVRRQRALDEALRADPSYRPALVLQAERLIETAEYEQATKALEPLVVADPIDRRTCADAMHALNMLSRHAEVMDVCTTPSPSALMLFERVLALHGLGRPAEWAPLWAALVNRPADDLLPFAEQSWTYLVRGEFAAAVRAADLALRAETHTDTDAYQRFVRVAGLCLQGLCERAREGLAEAPVPAGASAWVHQVQAFLLGRSGADLLISQAESPEQETEARFYVAIDSLGRGQAQAGLEHLAWIVEHGSNRVVEHAVAVAHHRRLTAESETAGDGAGGQL